MEVIVKGGEKTCDGCEFSRSRDIRKIPVDSPFVEDSEVRKVSVLVFRLSGSNIFLYIQVYHVCCAIGVKKWSFLSLNKLSKRGKNNVKKSLCEKDFK